MRRMALVKHKIVAIIATIVVMADFPNIVAGMDLPHIFVEVGRMEGKNRLVVAGLGGSLARYLKMLVDNHRYQMLSAEARALLPMLAAIAAGDGGAVDEDIEGIAVRLRRPAEEVARGIDELMSPRTGPAFLGRSTDAGGEGGSAGGAEAPWPEDLAPERQAVLELGLRGTSLDDPVWWRRTVRWLEGIPDIYWLDELRAYVAWWSSQPAAARHRNVARGFRNWLAISIRRRERDAQRKAIFGVVGGR